MTSSSDDVYFKPVDEINVCIDGSNGRHHESLATVLRGDLADYILPKASLGAFERGNHHGDDDTEDSLSSKVAKHANRVFCEKMASTTKKHQEEAGSLSISSIMNLSWSTSATSNKKKPCLSASENGSTATLSTTAESSFRSCKQANADLISEAPGSRVYDREVLLFRLYGDHPPHNHDEIRHAGTFVDHHVKGELIEDFPSFPRMRSDEQQQFSSSCPALLLREEDLTELDEAAAAQSFSSFWEQVLKNDDTTADHHKTQQPPEEKRRRRRIPAEDRFFSSAPCVMASIDNGDNEDSSHDYLTPKITLRQATAPRRRRCNSGELSLGRGRRRREAQRHAQTRPSTSFSPPRRASTTREQQEKKKKQPTATTKKKSACESLGLTLSPKKSTTLPPSLPLEQEPKEKVIHPTTEKKRKKKHVGRPTNEERSSRHSEIISRIDERLEGARLYKSESSVVDIMIWEKGESAKVETTLMNEADGKTPQKSQERRRSAIAKRIGERLNQAPSVPPSLSYWEETKRELDQISRHRQRKNLFAQEQNDTP